jgi:cell division inhibitor SepF
MKLMDRIKGFIFNPNDGEYEEIDEIVDDRYVYGDFPSDITPISEHRDHRTKKNSAVDRNIDTISLSTKKHKDSDVLAFPAHKIVFSEPTNFDEAAGVCDLVKQGTTVVAKLEGIDVKDGQRYVDFLNGAAHALEGAVHQVNNRVFMITPKGIEVTDHHNEQLKAHGIRTGNFRALFGGR